MTASHAAADVGKGLLVFPKHAARVLTGDRALRRVLNNSAWLLSSNSVGLALSFLQGILIARMLGAESFGAFALITSFTTVVNQFADSRV
ncbi:MAG TPA: oligosaccharide flippase family protein, partial [Vicinamibacterales bacterium]|nr:oligosaccharide flippase family protein [Vicinamibacterales bacterium]